MYFTENPNLLEKIALKNVKFKILKYQMLRWNNIFQQILVETYRLKNVSTMLGALAYSTFKFSI